jgi:hypothetical protein
VIRELLISISLSSASLIFEFSRSECRSLVNLVRVGELGAEGERGCAKVEDDVCEDRDLEYCCCEGPGVGVLFDVLDSSHDVGETKTSGEAGLR